MTKLYQSKVLLVNLLVLLTLWPDYYESLIITSVLAGDKKFKTISFDSIFLKPLTFEKDLPSTEFRRHRTVRPPKFDIDVNIPIKLPLEDEYPEQEYKKPVESKFFFQTGEINEPGYKKPETVSDAYASSSEQNQLVLGKRRPTSLMEQGFKLLPVLAKSIKFRPQIEYSHVGDRRSNARSDQVIQNQMDHGKQQVTMQIQESIPSSSYIGNSYSQSNSYDHSKQPEFIPGGFVNLKLSGPTGGPQMTYEDYDRERWAQQLSQTPGAMPYPILNYHQLQNFYGGLGTFTNGLADQRYTETGLKDKIMSSFSHLTSKFHIG